MLGHEKRSYVASPRTWNEQWQAAATAKVVTLLPSRVHVVRNPQMEVDYSVTSYRTKQKQKAGGHTQFRDCVQDTKKVSSYLGTPSLATTEGGCAHKNTEADIEQSV